MPSFQLLHFLQAIANRMKGGRPLQAAIAFPDIGVMAAFGQVKISWERRGLAQTCRSNLRINLCRGTLLAAITQETTHLAKVRLRQWTAPLPL
jgi:hypothetical protein